jgi:hypothetical protein
MADARNILPRDPYISAVEFGDPEDPHVLRACHHIEDFMVSERKCQRRGTLERLRLVAIMFTYFLWLPYPLAMGGSDLLCVRAN